MSTTKITSLVSLLVFPNLLHAQLTVTPNNNANDLITEIAGDGFSLSNTPTFIGESVQAGIFSDGFSAGLDIDAGIVFSTGDVNDILGPNDDTSSGQNLGGAGNDQLAEITGASSFDASGIEFTFETQRGDLSFSFLFASEEYPEFVGSSFNDVFGFFITPDTDPNTAGTQGSETINIALVPETDDIVSINTINGETNFNQFVDNTDGSENHQFNGRTTVLEASIEELGAGEHLFTIVIGDTADGIYDSAVFLSQGSFSVFTPLNGLPVQAAYRESQISILESGIKDVNARLLRLRTRTDQPVMEPKWNAFGSVYAYSESVDGRFQSFDDVSISIIPDYDLTVQGGTVGVEYRHHTWNFGAAFIANDTEVDIGRIGSIEGTGTTFAAYASYISEYIPTIGKVYADFLVSTGSHSNDISRLAETGQAVATSDSSHQSFEANLGYNFMGGNYRHGPFASVKVSSGELDGYTERNGSTTSFSGLDFDSTTVSLGYQLAKVIESNSGTFIPQVRFAYETEASNEGVFVDNSFLGTRSDDRFIGGLGLVYNTSANSNLFINYEGRFAEDFNSHFANLQFQYKF